MSIDWTPELAANYIWGFAGEVKAEVDRIERKVKALLTTRRN